MKRCLIICLAVVLCSAAQAALVGQWKLDGNVQDSVGTNDGAVLDPPLTYIAGAGNAADRGRQGGYFDGFARINVGHAPSLQPAMAISITAWIKVEQELSDNWQHIYRREGNSNTRELVAVGTWAGDAGVWFGIGTSVGYAEPVGIVTDDQMRDGNWHLAAVTYDSSVSGQDNLFIYWDGRIVGSTEHSGTMDTSNTNDAVIGGRTNGREAFVGGIDDFRIYSHALSPADVQFLYRLSALKITETDGGTDVVEGGATDTYDITIVGQYTGQGVTVQVSPGPQLDVGAGADTPINLNFTASVGDPNSWTVHTVTVAAVDDSFSEADHTAVITHLASSNDPNFQDLTAQVTVSIADNDGSAVLSKTAALVSEDGQQDEYTIHLEGSPPATDVIMAITTTDQAGVDKHYLTFTSGNYDIPQTVRIAAIDDDDAEGTRQTVFTHVLTGDPTYAGLPVENMVVTVVDNDQPARALIAQWKFDGNMADATGNGHNGQPNLDPNYMAGAPLGDDAGGRALNVSGGGQGCSVPHAAALKPLYGITLAAWIKADTFLGDPWQTIIRKDDGSGGRYLFQTGSWAGSDGLWLGIVAGGGYHEEVGVVDPAVLTDGQWHHVAGTYDGSAMKIYFDGVEKFSKPLTGTLGQAGTQPVTIGYNPSGDGAEPFDGGIDDVRIYNYGLSAREIQALMSVRAGNPDPANGSAGVDVAKVLGWSAPAAISNPTYNVYADSDFAKVDLADPSGQVRHQSIGQSGTSFDPAADLDIQSDIFWRVDVNDGTTAWPGLIWHFDTKITCNDAFPLLGDISSASGKPDCRVDLYDLAKMASEWLRCNQIPLSACQ